MASTTTDVSLLRFPRLEPARPTALWRLPLWSGLLVLTSLLLAYPVNLRLEPAVLWSPDVIPNLPLFGALLYLWMASLVGLLLTSRSDESVATWERLALVALAALVFRGFWNIPAPLQGQAMAHAAAARVWERLGHVVPHPSAAYLDWPGVSVASSVVSQVTGLDLFPAIAILTVFFAVLIGISAYVFLMGVLKSSLYAALASLLILEGSVTLIIPYNPGAMGLAFVVLLLAVLFQKGGLGTQSRVLLALLLLAGLTVSKLYDAMNFFFIALGLWTLTVLRRRDVVPGLALPTLMLFFVVVMAWNIYWGIGGFAQVTRWTALVFSEPAFILDRFTNVFTVGEANFGESAPIWYSRTRLFWLASLYFLGGLFWLWSLFRFRQIEQMRVRLTFAFGGVVLLGIIGGLVSSRGFVELLRLMTIGSFFTVPFLLIFLRQMKPVASRIGLTALIIAMVTLSFPTFLANNIRVNLEATHEVELAAGRWLRSLYGNGEGVRVYSTTTSFLLFIPEATWETQRPNDQFTKWDEENHWRSMDELLDKFDEYTQYARGSFYLHSPNKAVEARMTFGIPFEHPRWAALVGRLSENHDAVYDNGPIQLFSGEGFAR